MGTFDYLDRRPHKPTAIGEGSTVYLHVTPVTVTPTSPTVVKVTPIIPTPIKVEYQGD